MEKITINGIEYDLVPRVKSEQDYPIFKRNEDGEVFKITTDDLYSIVLSEESQDIGRTIYNRNSLLNHCETIPHDKETGLYYLQPVWCWDNTDEYIKQIGFYTEKNKVIHPNNSFGALDWESIEPVTPEQLQTMPFIWEMYQKLLNKRKN